jgi:DNA uptake protein ComE-like DNA-binding protein
MRQGIAAIGNSRQNVGVRKPLMIAVLLACLVGCVEIALPQETSNQSKNAVYPTEKVDINHASVDELMQVPRITRVWAERIVRYRPYRGKNQLLLDGIVPNGVYLRIKDHVVAHRHLQ